MDLLTLVAAALISFLSSYVFLPWLIGSLRGTTVVGVDLNKPNRPMIPEMGGLGVILGSYVGISFLAVLAFQDIPGPVYFASISAALGAGVVGLLDDMFRLPKRSKSVLPFVLALPLGAIVLQSGNRNLLGIDVGFLIALIVPLGVTSAANAANMLEGLNGLGAGLGIIMTVALIVLSVLLGAREGLFLLLPLLGALSAFLWFNRYPSRVFPGDSMTLFTGATIACAAIISSPPLKTYGAILFAPMVLEFVLKARGRFQGENYGEIGSDGRLRWSGRIESIVHAVMRWKPLKEQDVVLVIWGLEIVVCSVVILTVAVGA